jgi:hypothetical protein
MKRLNFIYFLAAQEANNKQLNYSIPIPVSVTHQAETQTPTS